MPGVEIAQYGIAIFAVAILGYVFVNILPIINNQSKSKESDKIIEVVQNNTEAIQELLGLIREMQIEITKEQMKLDELVDITRNTLKRGRKHDE